MHSLMHGSKGKAKPKALKEFHAKEQHDGKYHVTRGNGKGQPIEHSAEDLSDVHQALEEHMGTPNEGEAESEAPEMGAGEPGMGGQA